MVYLTCALFLTTDSGANTAVINCRSRTEYKTKPTILSKRKRSNKAGVTPPSGRRGSPQTGFAGAAPNPGFEFNY